MGQRITNPTHSIIWFEPTSPYSFKRKFDDRRAAVNDVTAPLFNQLRDLEESCEYLRKEFAERRKEQEEIGKQQEKIGKEQEEIGKEQEEIGKQQEKIGKQQEEIGKQQEKIGKQQEEISKGFAEIRKDQEEIRKGIEGLEKGQQENIRRVNELKCGLKRMKEIFGRVLQESESLKEEHKKAQKEFDSFLLRTEEVMASSQVLQVEENPQKSSETESFPKEHNTVYRFSSDCIKEEKTNFFFRFLSNLKKLLMSFAW